MLLRPRIWNWIELHTLSMTNFCFIINPWIPEKLQAFPSCSPQKYIGTEAMHQAIYSAQFSSVQPLSRVWLCDPMDRSTAGFPVHHQLPELAQTHVHRVGDAIQPSHPLSSPSPPAFSHVSKTIKWDSCNDNKYEYFLTNHQQAELSSEYDCHCF